MLHKILKVFLFLFCIPIMLFDPSGKSAREFFNANKNSEKDIRWGNFNE